jgi:integrase
MLYTGMRRGEALALTWNDIDFENHIIKVTKATEYKNSKPKQKAPKTGRGMWDIPMPEDLHEFLIEHKKHKRVLYVFPGHTGGPMGMSELNRQWRRAKRRIERGFESPMAYQVKSARL